MAILRLFIAIEIPSAIRAGIAEVLHRLKSSDAGVRWEQPAKLHLTLKFLGDTEEQQLPLIRSALKNIAALTAPFKLSYSQLGCFPNTKHPRIVWVGVEDPLKALAALAEHLESSMAAAGFERERKPFHPHVTIGRVRTQDKIPDLIRMMESITFESQPTHVTQLVLIKSDLHQSGSVYTTLDKITFSSITI